ncbi:hypothetical protein OG21DRAFT_1395757, partial [Imleria badia]
MKALGHTMLVAYAYNNFDVDLKMSDQHAEKSSDMLKHPTSGILFPLQHRTTAVDLRCSRTLWEQSIYNIEATKPALSSTARRAGKTHRDLLGLHEKNQGTGAMSCRRQYNAWKMMLDLIEHGPEYFWCFWDLLGELDIMEAIPVVR